MPKTRSEISEILGRRGENQPQSDGAFLAQGFGRYEFTDNSFTRAHFLSKQVVPASLLLESIFQCTAMTVYNHLELSKGLHALIVSIKIDLRKAIEIGEVIDIVSKIERIDRGIIRTLVTCHSGEESICNAELKYWYPLTKADK